MNWFTNLLFNKSSQLIDHPHVLSTKHFDLSEGYEVLSKPSCFLGWDTSYDDLQRLGVCSIKQNMYSMDYTFIYPVRIGAVIFPNFQACHYKSDHVSASEAVSNYSVSFRQNRIFSDAIKKSFRESLAIKSDNTYKIEDNFSFKLSIKGLIFYISENGLIIENKRDFKHIRQNIDYENKMCLSQVLPLGRATEIQTDYRKSSFIKRTPPQLLEQFPNQSFAWIDEKNNVFGLVGWQNSVIVPQHLLKAIVLEVTQPAKGGGFSVLNLQLENEHIQISYGSSVPLGKTDKRIEDLGKFFHVPITYNDLGYDI